MKLKIILFLLLAVPFLASGQDAEYFISGRVVSNDDGNPLGGVNVYLKSSGKSTFTDAEGRFRIDASGDSTVTIICSYLGYDDRIISVNPGTSGPLLIELNKNITQLDEVIVSTGYWQLPQARATGSFEQIDSELFQRQISTDVISRLDGIANSVLFDKRSGGIAFSIRGLSTFLSEERPLVVVDNFPFEGSLNSINPHDIESITILKDAAAASIWGAQAGNGVLVITTKKARYNQPFKLSMTSNLTVAERPDLFYHSQMTSSDFIDVEQFLFEQGAYDSDIKNTRNRPFLTPVVEILNKQREGLITEEEANQQIDKFRNRDVRRDLQDYFYRKAINQQYNLQVQGGSSNSRYLLSAGYDKNLRNEVGNSYERISIRAMNTFRPIKNLEIQGGIIWSHHFAQNNHPGEVRNSISDPVYPYAQLADEQGKPLILERQYRLSYVDTAGSGRLLDWHYRPLEEIRLSDNTSKTQDLLFKFNARYQLFPFLNAQLSYQFQNAVSEGRDYFSESMWYTRDLINRFTVIDGETTTYNVPLGGILDQSQSKLASHALRGQLNLNEEWGDKHQLAALVGGELRDNRRRTGSSRTYGFDEDLLTYQYVDFINRLPIYDNLSSSSYIPDSRAFYSGLDRFVSVFANASYSYDNRYILSASARRDASNLFGVETNDKWKPLWSAGFAWNIAEESFFNSRIIPNLKLRFTYGYAGNVNNSVAAVTTIEYQRPKQRVTSLQNAIVVNPPNPSLRWEQVRTINTGVDFSLINNIVDGSIEYYSKKSTDLISRISPVDVTTGFSSLTKNSAVLRTTGIDVNLSAAPLKGPVAWESNLLFSYNRHKVLKYLDERRLNSLPGHGAVISPIEGHGAYDLVSHRWGGLDPETGDPRGFINGEISTEYADILNDVTMDDLVFHGSALPQYFGAFRNTINWQNFSFSANVTFRFDYFFRKETINYTSLFSRGIVGHGDYYKRWQKPGDEEFTTVPSIGYPVNSRRDQFYTNSEVNVEKGDHIRLHDIRMSYTIDKRLWPANPFQQLAVIFYARNLGIIWKANDVNLDPDYRSALPATQSFSVGVKANF